MIMSMMHVGHVGVRMHQWRMLMPMRVQFFVSNVSLMLVLMMFVVNVRMRMAQRFMTMFVLMVLAQMQPNAQRHEGGSDNELCIQRFAENATAIPAPKNGAVEKYAPVRAVPRCRSASPKSAAQRRNRGSRQAQQRRLAAGKENERRSKARRQD